MAVVDELKGALPDEFSAKILDGGLQVLNSDNPIRAHLFAAAVRELLGHILQSLAPDEEVQACTWYVAVEDRPTRRQRVTYAVQGGLSYKIVEQVGIDVSEMQDELTAAFTALNKRTHVRPKTILSDQHEIDEFSAMVVGAALEFLSAIDHSRATVAGALDSFASAAAFGQFVEESIDDLVVIAGHHYIEHADVEEVTVKRITARELHYAAEGTVYVTLEYGSGSDAGTMSAAFPFSCNIVSSVDALDKIISVDDLTVDTSSWYE